MTSVLRETTIDATPDGAARRLAYTVVDGPLGAAHHNAAAQVVPDGGGTRFLWVTDVLPDALAGPVGRFDGPGPRRHRRHAPRPGTRNGPYRSRGPVAIT